MKKVADVSIPNPCLAEDLKRRHSPHQEARLRLTARGMKAWEHQLHLTSPNQGFRKLPR